MGKSWRAAVVGTGVVGDWHVRVLSGLPNVELVALCDREPSKAQKLVEKYNLSGVKVYAEQAEMHRSEQLDVAHICTPSGDHLDPASLAMKSGVNVICEKPMEIQLDRIDRMIELARSSGVRLAGIFQTRWNDASRALKTAVEQGRFGTIAFGGCYTPWYRTDQYYRDGGWRGTWKLDGGGAIMNQSVHAVDLLQWIVGPVKTVSAHASSRIHPEIEVEDTLACALTFENGAHGVITGSTAMYPGTAVRIEIGGADGTAVAENGLKVWKFRAERETDQALLSQVNQKKAENSSGASSNTGLATDLHARNIQHIFRAWEDGRDADTAGPEARKAVAIILAMYESAKRQGEPVRVK